MSNKMNEALKVLANRQRIIREQADDLEHDHPSEIEPVEDVWSGGENIALDLDHAHVTHGADEQVKEPEVLDIVELRQMVEEIIGEQRVDVGRREWPATGGDFSREAEMADETRLEAEWDKLENAIQDAMASIGEDSVFAYLEAFVQTGY